MSEWGAIAKQVYETYASQHQWEFCGKRLDEWEKIPVRTKRQLETEIQRVTAISISLLLPDKYWK
jgi:hypothetical protein